MVINGLSIYGYNRTSQYLKATAEAKVMAYQHKLYENQLNTIRESEQTLRKIKHDIKNHLLTIDILIKNKSYDEVTHYLDTLGGQLSSNTVFSETGNIVVDSIINHKLHMIKELGAEIQSRVILPSEIDMAPLDLTVIIGNLLDNTIDAIKKISPDNRKVIFDIRYSKGRLILKLMNTYDGIIKKKHSALVTTKESKELHGFGLSNVNDAIKKYDGQINISYTSKEFTVLVMCFC